MESNWNKPNGYYVDIAGDKEIKFLDRCVYCNKPNPDSTVDIQGNPVGYFGLWKWQFGANPKLSIPVHKSCGKKIKKSTLKRNLLLSFIGLIVLAVGLYIGWTRWEILGAFIAAAILPIIWQVKNSPKFEFEYGDNVFEFRFSDLSYAEEFAKINNGKLTK